MIASSYGTRWIGLSLASCSYRWRWGNCSIAKDDMGLLRQNQCLLVWACLCKDTYLSHYQCETLRGGAMVHTHTHNRQVRHSADDEITCIMICKDFLTQTRSPMSRLYMSQEIILHICQQPRRHQQHVQQANHWLASLTLTPRPLLTWNRTALSRVDNKLCGSVAAGWYIICHVTEGLIVF